MQEQVVFRFGDQTELRYLERKPYRGQVLTGMGGTWIVASVRRDADGTCIADCDLVETERADGRWSLARLWHRG
jgi:hypothetical protein